MNNSNYKKKNNNNNNNKQNKNKICKIITKNNINTDYLIFFQKYLNLYNNNINPQLYITPININNEKIINVVQESILICGTKTRVAYLLLKGIIEKNPEIKTLTYCGTYNGFGAVATAYAAYLLNKNCEVFLSRVPMSSNYIAKSNEEILNSRQVISLIGLNAKVHLCDDYRSARDLQYSLSTKEVEGKTNEWELINGYYNVDLGLLDKKGVMVNILSEQIKKASKRTILENYKNPSFWLVVGTGGVARSIKKTFPDATLYLLFVGKYDPDTIFWTRQTKGIIVLNGNPDFPIDTNISNENIKSNRELYYNSTSGYDDRIWKFVKKYAKNGDFIWNVAADNFSNLIPI